MFAKLYVFAFFGVIFTADEFKGNKNWCVPLAESTVPTPTLPKQFQATVEANYRNNDKNFTIEYDEYYDFINNKGLIVKYDSGRDPIRQYFLYDTDEMITVYSRTCDVKPLKDNAKGTPFGYEVINGTGHIYSPTKALTLEYNQEFLGTEIIRGIVVDRFNSCAYFDELKSTVRIYWSFSNPIYWHSAKENGAVPVELYLEGLSDKGDEWSIQYQYIKFRDTLTVKPEIFETPVGNFCPGRKPTKPVPSIPKHFYFRIEATSTDLNLTTNLAEWYDDENKLVRMDSQTITPEDIAIYGKTSITEIHDFQRGIRFIIDRKNEKCLNVTKLDPQGPDADYTDNKKFVKLRPVLELFNFDKDDKIQYQYHGTKKIRDIDADVWIARRSNWPPHPTINRTSTWEWYFMSKEWVILNHGEVQHSIPMKLIITHYNYDKNANTYISNTIVHNYYDYNEEKPDIFSFDLHDCFTDVQIKNLGFSLNSTYVNLIKNKREFKYRIADSIAKAAYLLPTRITNIDIQEKNDKTFVSFKMLDKLPKIGNVQDPVEDISIDDAYSLLAKSIKNGKLIVQVNDAYFSANSGSLREVDETENKKISDIAIYISIGAAFGGVIFGIVLTVIIVNTIRKKNNESPILSMSGLLNQNFKD